MLLFPQGAETCCSSLPLAFCRTCDFSAKVAFLGWGNQVAGNVLSGSHKDQNDEAACHLHLKAKVVDVWSAWMSGQFASTGGCAWKEVPRPTASSPQIFAMVDPFVSYTLYALVRGMKRVTFPKAKQLNAVKVAFRQLGLLDHGNADAA